MFAMEEIETMEEMNQQEEAFFGMSPLLDDEVISDIPKEVSEKNKKTYFQAISDFQNLCKCIKSEGAANGNALKKTVDDVIKLLKEDERMLVGLANSQHSYTIRQLDCPVYTSIVIHGVNVMVYSLKLSIDIGVPDIRLPYIAIAALFHRLGLIALPEERLLSLTANAETVNEIDSYEQSPEEFINSVSIDDFHVDSVQYLIALVKDDQQVLKKTSLREAMYQYSMVIHLCFEFERLTHQISNENALSPLDAMKKMRDEMQGYFQPDIIKFFFNKLSIYPLGTFVKLSSNEIAKIVRINENFIIRPEIIIVLDHAGKEKVTPTRINLRTKPNLYIKKGIVNDFLTEKYIGLF
jgi:HD-GYP domain-containing protein (c-di-GMP phosphodiesterase class II)